MSEIEKLMQNANIKKKKTHFQGFEDWFWEYPPFTAEKQIELICLLLNADIKIDICKDPNMKMEISDIAEALAEVTNTIWQDLTEEEKQQVKGILE